MAKIPNKKPLAKRTVMKAISDGLLVHIERLAKMVAKGNRNEEETRRWVVDVLRTAFGYVDDQIETEMKALGKRVDIAIKSKDKVILVIECKASSINLTASAVLQATNYAAALGAEWAAVTNGRRWLLYHVTPKKGEEPIIDEIFDVELLDDNGISKDDIDSLYLLTEQALISGETIKTFHFFNCTSQEKIFQAIVSEPVVHVICEELQKLYKQEAGVLSKDINPSFIQELLVEMFINDELE